MKYRNMLRAALSAALSLTVLASAALAAPPGKPGGGSGNSSVTYDGATTITESTTQSGQTYTSTTGSQNALLATGGTSTITNPTVTKTGSPDGRSDDYDFYGTNAAVIATSGATLNISGGSVTTDASYANAVYANGTGKINISGTTVKTSSNNSGGVMVTGGGTLNATDLTVTTSGNSSAAIRSDRGGGTLTVTGGTYTTSGTGSPVIYSTADITAKNAELTATASEGVVVEGGNSVTLIGSTLSADNTKLNGQSATYKGIFLYQSMSGDATNGGGSFTATDSTIVSNNGDVFFVTNNSATITLKNNTIVNNDASGALLRAQAGAWGTSGSNGGHVTLTLDNQTVSGDIYIDDISTLTLILKNRSSFTGTINGDNTAKSIVVELSADSTITLTGDSYVYSIDNAGSGNVVTNGYTLTTGAGTSGGAAAASNSGSSGGGLTPPDMPGGEGGFPGDGQMPPDKPDGENGIPGGGQTPPDLPEQSYGQQTPPAANEESLTVALTTQNLTVDGETQNAEIYNINGSNYFKLRDIAMMLNGTDAQFSVDYDAASRTISVTTGQDYTPQGGELEPGADRSASCVKSTQTLTINGRSVEMTAYNLGGYNFFKLRELGVALGFGVDYDETTRTMLVTSK